MTDTQGSAAHATGAPGHDPEPHGLGHHGDTHGQNHHSHGEETLGPIDWTAWTIGFAGVVVGLAMWMCFVIATQAG